MEKDRKLRFLVLIIGICLIAVASLVSYINKNPNYNQIVSSENADDKIGLDFVSGTEYVLPRDHNGSTIVKLRDSKQNFINTSCYNTILYPDRSIYQIPILMLQDEQYGTYYQHWEIPESLGIFDQEVQCEVKGKNVSQAKAFHVANMTNILLQATDNLNQSINAVLSALNCSNLDYFQTCAYLQSINDSVHSASNISLIISNTTTTTLTSINSTLSDLTKIFLTISSQDCYVGSTWTFTINATDESYHSLPFLTCYVNSSRFGYEILPYSKSLNSYQITHNCTSPAGQVNWSTDCFRNY